MGPSPAHAQTPEPTPTATPAWQQVVTLTSGNAVLIERRVSYGDIAVVVAVLALMLVLLALFFVWSPRLRM